MVSALVSALISALISFLGCSPISGVISNNNWTNW
tara:strand:+ start:1379 stop:1483 length:105 start_codon:yes stop_codon:yes gene_type:complete